MSEDERRRLTRRDLLRIASAAGAAAIVPPAAIGPPPADAAAAGLTQPAAVVHVREPLLALSASEADILDAVVARLIPSDATGPGATEAMAARYIDRALAGFLAPQREAYRTGLAALDQYARSSRGAAFTALTVGDQDAVLVDLETGAATRAGAAFPGSSAQFFALIRGHTMQGTFGDPFYGGNAGFIGWDLIGYPGVRTAVTANEQQMGAAVTPNHRSAYDGGMFNKAQASLDHSDRHARERHGD
jgi:gluconate 2-dehydrogenase gamma chain